MALHFVTGDAATAGVGDTVTLRGPEAHHAASVRRVRAGETVTLGDGSGVWLIGECTAASPQAVEVLVNARRVVERPGPRLTLVQALAKGDRDELAVQAATELGVDAVVPWQAERSVSRWDGKEAKRLARWETIVREAAKQAHRPWIPEMRPLARTAQLAELAQEAGRLMLVLDPGADAALSAESLPEEGDITLVVGPEGGVSPAEIERLRGAGARVVRLGESVLRTSTAGAAALAVVNVRLGRW